MNNNMINYSAKEINELLDWISYNHLLFGDELNEAFQKEFNALLEKVYEKAPETVVYNTEDEMKIKLVELAKEDYKIGDVVFIVDNNVPDYWIVDVADEQNQEGYYGYFKVSPLEAKTNLNEYYNKEDVDDLIKKAIESRIWDVLNTTNKTVTGAINELSEKKADGFEVNTKFNEVNTVNESQQTDIDELKVSVKVINSTLNDNPENGANGVVSNVEILLKTTEDLNQGLTSANETILAQGQDIIDIKAKNESQDTLINTLDQQLDGVSNIANSALSGVNSLGEIIESTYAKQANVYTKNETYNKGEVDNKITEALTNGTISLDNYYNKQDIDSKLTPLLTEGFVRIEENFSPTLMEGVDKCELYVRDMSYFTSGDPYAEETRIGRYNDTTNSIIIKKDTRILEFEGIDEGSFSYVSVNGDVYKYELPLALADMVITPNEYSDYAFFVRLDNTTTAYDKDYIDKYYYRKNEVVTRQTFEDFYDKVVAPAFEGMVSELELEGVLKDVNEYLESNYVTKFGIKTINGESILGEGDLVIEGGNTTVDSVFDGTSTNPVEAQAIEKYISDKLKPINETLNSKANSADLASKQDTLVSGTNIKTINGESILGTGDITIGDNGETVSTMTGATSTLPGEGGLVPTPTAGSNTKFLRGDATWAEIPSDDSKQDKLNFDSEPTENSENSLKSGAIYSAIEAIKALMPKFILDEDILTIVDNTEE